MYYEIAECKIKYEPIYPYLREKMEEYRMKEERKDAPTEELELSFSKSYCEELHRIYPNLSEEECEYIFVGAEFYRKLLKLGGVMLHASAVIVDHRAYLFLATSDEGKSTHTKQWQKLLGEERAVILNDDKPLLRKIEGQWYAYGTPFSEKADAQVNQKVPLHGICMLEEGETNQIKKMDAAEALPLLLQQTLNPKEEKTAETMKESLDQLLLEIPVYRMQCTVSTDAAELAYETMRD